MIGVQHVVLEGEEYPALVRIWDNPDDSLYDDCNGGVGSTDSDDLDAYLWFARATEEDVAALLEALKE